MSKAGMRVPVVMVSACIGLAAGAAAVGQEGALKPVACDPAEGNPYPRPHTSALLGRKVARGMGAASPKAIYGVARPITATISVAADYIRPDANEPDAIRIAFDGSGRFDPENPLALRAMPSP